MARPDSPRKECVPDLHIRADITRRTRGAKSSRIRYWITDYIQYYKPGIPSTKNTSPNITPSFKLSPFRPPNKPLYQLPPCCAYPPDSSAGMLNPYPSVLPSRSLLLISTRIVTSKPYGPQSPLGTSPCAAGCSVPAFFSPSWMAWRILPLRSGGAEMALAAPLTLGA